MATLQHVINALKENNNKAEVRHRDLIDHMQLSTKLSTGFLDFFAQNVESKGDRLEAQIDSKSSRTGFLTGLGNAGSGIGEGIGSAFSGAGGLFGGLGSMFGGLGKGIGFAGAGIGAALFGLAFALESLPSAESIKKDTETLLSIGDGYENAADRWEKTGFATATLLGLGTGLAFFGVGSAINGLADLITEDGWANKVKEDTETLLSIGKGYDDAESRWADGAYAFLALKYIGKGLAFFGVGEAAIGIADLIAKDDWATKVKDDVETLLSIGKGYEDAESRWADGAYGFVALTGLGVALGIFAVGKFFNAIPDWISRGDWATRVKDDVEALLSIGEGYEDAADKWANGGFAFLALSGLGIALIPWAIGKFADAVASWIAKDDWATTIKDDVETLLSIGDGYTEDESRWGDTGFIVTALTSIGAGLGVFGVGKGIAGIANWITGNGSEWAEDIKKSVETLLQIANIENIDKDLSGFQTAMEQISEGVGVFAGTGVSTAGSNLVARFLNMGGGDKDWSEDILNKVKKLAEAAGAMPLDKSVNFKLSLGHLADGLTQFNEVGKEGVWDSLKTRMANLVGGGGLIDHIIELSNYADPIKAAAEGLQKMADAISSLGNLNIKDDKDSLHNFVKNISKVIPMLRGLSEGGTILIPNPNGPGGISYDFGPKKSPGSGGLLDPDLNLDKLSQASRLIKQTLGMSTELQSLGNNQANEFDATAYEGRELASMINVHNYSSASSVHVHNNGDSFTLGAGALPTNAARYDLTRD